MSDTATTITTVECRDEDEANSFADSLECTYQNSIDFLAVTGPFDGVWLVEYALL